MRLVGGLVVVLCAASSFAQVIYEPVQYQYKSGGRSYYYGGADARVHMSAAWPMVYGADWGRSNGLAFHSANVHTHREVATERPRVYTDALPLRNAYIYGFTANDARNEARPASSLRHALAISRYAALDSAVNIGRPTLLRCESEWRPQKRSLGHVTVGTPIHIASHVVKPPPYGNGSSARSTRP